MTDFSSRRYDVLIVGGGLLGLSVAYHLRKKNSLRVALVSENSSEGDEGFMTLGSYLDNFTRLSHQWGEEKSKKLWSFSHKAYHYAYDLAKELGVSSKKGKRYRFATSHEEEKEMTQAASELKASSFFCELQERKVFTGSFLLQDEGELGGFIEAGHLKKALRKALRGKIDFIKGRVEKIESKKEEMLSSLENGTVLRSETLVLACHTGSRKLLPELKDVLVPYGDQSHLFSFQEKIKNKDFEAMSFSASHGYIWGAFKNNQTLQIGGGRHLRKLAGIGLEKAKYSEKVSDFLHKIIPKLFPSLEQLKEIGSFASIEIRPCDETLVLGPMYGESRIFLGAGFMGQGLTLATYGGSCLSDLILRGSSKNLPHFFYPERFRSL